MVGTPTRLSRRKWWLTNVTIWDAPPELAAPTIHKPTTTLHRHYRSKHGTIFEVSVNPQSQQHASMNEELRSEHVDVHMMDRYVDEIDVDHPSYQDLLRVSRKYFFD
jgi:hypothetical protein